MQKILHRLLPVLFVIIFVGAAWLLWHELKHYHLTDIRQAFHQIPRWRLWLAGALMIVNYLVLIGYDVLAIRTIHHPLPLSKIALVSFTGFVSGYNFGSLLGGTSVRYRLYAAWGLSAVEILQLVVMLAVTFWVGIFALAGVCFTIQPFPIPQKLHLPFDTVRPLGFLLLALTVGYVGFTRMYRSSLRIHKTDVQLPRLGMIVLQLTVAAVDLMVAAACLYVLVSHELTVGYGAFLGMYLLAMGTAIVTHVPGGIGVFELIILTLAAPESSVTFVAALLAFRVIYYLLPLLVAIVLLAAHELLLRRVAAKRMWSDISHWVGTVTPPCLAWATLLAGMILLLSGATPIVPAHLGGLARPIALPLAEASPFVGSLVGASLVLLARGLQRRLDSAWWLSMVFLGLGITAALLQGFDYEKACFLSIVLIALVASHQRFSQQGTLIHQRFTPAWASSIVLALLCSLWFGWFAYQHIEYTSDLWWTFTFRSNAPRFLRASVGAVTVLFLVAIRQLLSAHQPPPCDPTQDALTTAAGSVNTAPHPSANLALRGHKSLRSTPQISYSSYTRRTDVRR